MRSEFLIILIVVSISNAFIIIIPDDYKTIQEGINASTNTDSILVSKGIYYENLNITDKSLTLCSLFLTTGDTTYISNAVLNGSDSASVISITNSDSVKIIGFTITNGYSGKGAGIYVQNSGVTVASNIIENNKMIDYGRGGGIYLENSTGTIEENIIRDNTEAYEGGGIKIDSCQSVFLYKNKIYGHSTNSIFGMASGAGMHISNSTNIILKSNLFFGNWVDVGSGEMITIDYSSVSLINCTLYNSSTKPDGASLLCLNSELNLKNTIIWSGPLFYGNSIDTLLFPEDKSKSTLNIEYSDIEDFNIGGSNIDADPLFANFSNFELDLQSPCINRGDPSYEPDPDGTVADMGWYPFDLAGYGTISGTVNLEEGIGLMRDVQVSADTSACYPLSDGRYQIQRIFHFIQATNWPACYNIVIR